MMLNCFVRGSLIAPKNKIVKDRIGKGEWSRQGRNGWASWSEKLMVPFKAVMGKEILRKKMSYPIFSKIYCTHVSFLDSFAFGSRVIGSAICNSISDWITI